MAEEKTVVLDDSEIFEIQKRYEELERKYKKKKEKEKGKAGATDEEIMNAARKAAGLEEE